jgi:hypothetical protein
MHVQMTDKHNEVGACAKQLLDSIVAFLALWGWFMLPGRYCPDVRLVTDEFTSSGGWSHGNRSDLGLISQTVN